MRANQDVTRAEIVEPVSSKPFSAASTKDSAATSPECVVDSYLVEFAAEAPAVAKTTELVQATGVDANVVAVNRSRFRSIAFEAMLWWG